MITVKLPESEMNKIRTAMRNKSSDSAKKVREVVKKSTVEMDGEVKELLSRKGTGEKYRIPTIKGARGGKTRIHTASAPGEPPAKQYTFLIDGIHWEVLGNRMTGRVKSQVNYSKYLEYGTPRVAARPFMRPAAEKIEPRFNNAIKKIFK